MTKIGPGGERETSRPRAVVLGVDHPRGLAVVRSLARAGVPVVAIDHLPKPPAAHSRYLGRCLQVGADRADQLAALDRLGRGGRRRPDRDQRPLSGPGGAELRSTGAPLRPHDAALGDPGSAHGQIAGLRDRAPGQDCGPRLLRARRRPGDAQGDRRAGSRPGGTTCSRPGSTAAIRPTSRPGGSARLPVRTPGRSKRAASRSSAAQASSRRSRRSYRRRPIDASGSRWWWITLTNRCSPTASGGSSCSPIRGAAASCTPTSSAPTSIVKAFTIPRQGRPLCGS